MFADTIRLPIFAWPIAWGCTAMAFYVSRFGLVPFDEVKSGPTTEGAPWVPFLVGMIAWAWAGSMSFHGKLLRKGALTWGLAFALAFACSRLAPEQPQNTLDRPSLWQWLAPYVLAGLGTTVGPVAHVLTGPRYWPLADLLRFALGWAISCLVGAFVGVMSAGLGVILVGMIFRTTGIHQWLLPLGAAIGATMGGLLPGMVAMVARDHRPRQRVALAELEEI